MSRVVPRYRLFGLSIESELPLPELVGQQQQQDANGREADISIRLGSAGEGDARGYNLDIDDVARFVIAGGRSITIDPAPGVGEADIRLFLLGSAMGAALHQRGILPLHANAVVVDSKAVAFTGRSGAGKSTLAAWFHDQGHQILADDVCVIRIGSEGHPWAYPGLPRLRLWEDALAASGRDAAHHTPSFHVSGDDRRKFDVRIPAGGIAGEPLPLAALFSLEESDEFAIERLSGSAAVEAISANTYRGQLIAEVGDSAAHLAACVTIARTVPIMRLQRPFDRGKFDAQCREIIDHCLAMPSG